jgi:hypothetical protein
MPKTPQSRKAVKNLSFARFLPKVFRTLFSVFWQGFNSFYLVLMILCDSDKVVQTRKELLNHAFVYLEIAKTKRIVALK